MATPMHPVVSSQISYIGYNNEDKELFVIFKNNSTYRYDGVPRKLYESLMMSTSKGKYLNEHIKNIYVSTQIK